MSRADPPAPAVCWARVDSAGADITVPRGWLDGRPELRPYLAAAAALSAECTFLWCGPGGRLLNVQLTTGTSDRTRATSIEATVTPAEAPHGLTPRELEVLTLIACGLDNTAIAARIGISRRTVATHVEHLLAKLDAPTRTAAAVIATTENLLTLPLQGDARALPRLPVLRLEAAVRGEPTGPRRPRSPARHHRKHDIVIGGVYPSFGPSVTDGVVRRKATELAVAEINRQGGIAGHPLRHIGTTTDITDPTALRAAIRTLVEQCPDAITLGYTLAARDDFASLFAEPAELGCPVLHTATSASAQRLVLDEPTRFGNIFQVCAPEARYGAGFVRTLDDLSGTGQWTPPNRDIVVLDSVDTNLVTFTTAAADLAERSRWRLTLRQIDFLKPDWGTVVDRVVAVQPAAIMIATWLPDTLIDFLRRVRPRTPDTLMYAIYAPSVPGFAQDAGPLAEGLLWATVIGLYQDTLAGQFAQQFTAVHHSDAGRSGAGIHYDMVHLLSNTWRQVENPRDFAAVSRRLRQLVHRGVSGAYYFGNHGQTALTYPDDTPDASLAQAHLVHQIQRGQHVIVAPSPYASARFRPSHPPASATWDESAGIPELAPPGRVKGWRGAPAVGVTRWSTG